jgi:hypothetical protein
MYTKELTAAITEEYVANPTRETVDALAIKHEKSVKSIIGKLSREKVYRREIYVTKTGEKPVTKLELVGDIAVILDVTPSKLEGLEKSPKGVLVLIREKLENLEDARI